MIRWASLRELCLFSGAVAMLAAVSSAGGPPNIAIVAAEFPITSPYFLDPQAKLQASGFFGVVDIIDAKSTTPTLAQLQAYDAVLTWSDFDYQDSTALGDVMADYVDAGGGVVVAVFGNCELSPSRTLLGRWVTGGYPVIVPQLGVVTGQASLGVVHVPGHPLMAGVASFVGGSSSYRPQTPAMTTGSVSIADWSDGRRLVAVHGTKPGRVDLGFFPPSSTASWQLWDASTDGGVLLSNAMRYVSNAGGPASIFCSGDGGGANCPCFNYGTTGNGCANSLVAGGAHLAKSGAASLSHDTLVLTGSGMPNGSALYFQGTTKTAGGAGIAFGDGLRCAGGTIVRLKPVANVAGSSHIPQAGDPHVSVRGLIAAPGVRTYQVWYRNAANYCTASTFNLTNGVEVTWLN